MASVKWNAQTRILCRALLLLASTAFTSFGQAQLSATSREGVQVNVLDNLQRLIAERDTDGDRKITVEDLGGTKAGEGEPGFWLVSTQGIRYEVVGSYPLSNLLQELTILRDAGADTATITPSRIFENPVHRISRSIRELYWDGLTRRIDREHLHQILVDEKVSSGGFHYLYVPHGDRLAHAYFSKVAQDLPSLRLKVERLPSEVTPEYIRSLEGKHGLLSLALEQRADGSSAGVPFVVPGGRFNEMYGWDSYFETLGLLADGRSELGKATVDNFVFQINHYGKILNANRSYYLTRSHPPFLTSTALAVYEHLPRNPDTKAWLRKAIEAAIEEYGGVWMDKNHLTETGLSRYFGTGLGVPPEVEPGHFDAIFRAHAEQRDMDPERFEALYRAGSVKVPELDAFFVHDRCVRESGHDTTYRWDFQGDRCADFVTVDLNSLLYKMELDVARTIEREFGGTLERLGGKEERASAWYEKAEKRKNLINEYLWDGERGMFLDYDLVSKRRRYYVSATTFYPLWASNGDDPKTRLATQEQAETLLKNVLPQLELPGGVAASSQGSRGPLTPARPARQWDYPHGWAPHQMLVWQGLLNYGYRSEANRLIYRWLYAITRNAADYNGTIPEKFDVAQRSHQVFAEYGNVGTKFAYITREGFGWMNASYQVGLQLLPRELRESLERLVPPEQVFGW